MTNDNMPAERFPPGNFIKEEYEARGWTQGDLAAITGIDLAGLNLIINGKRQITPETAAALGEAFDTGAQFWLNLESSYRLWQRRPDVGSVARAARLYDMLPIREMIKRGWIENSKSVEILERNACRFLGIGRITDEPAFFHHAAMKASGYDTPATNEQLAWLYRVKGLADEMVVPKYSHAKLSNSIDRLSAFLSAPEEARHVPRLLAECGVRFLVVESLPGAKIDGACFWLDDGKAPVIGLSMRFDRIDNFWFVLRHEIEHVLRRDGLARPMLDAELEGERAGTSPNLPQEERHANAAAAAFCVPSEEMDSWIARKDPFYSEADLIGFSRRLGIHPGVAAGQLRRRTGRYNLFAKHLAKVRSIVASSTIVDGWGEIAPIAV